MAQMAQNLRKGKGISILNLPEVKEANPTITLEETLVSGDKIGNTTLVAQKARIWIWTWNNYSQDDKKNMAQFCLEHCVKYAFQEEVGKEGTPHLQGYWEFKNARYFKSLKELFPKLHIEKANNIKAAQKYCVKDDTRSGETFTNIEQLWDPLDKLEKTKWQIDLIELFKSRPDQRKVYWLWESKGGVGKTTFKRHIRITNPKSCLTFSGKGSDIKHSVSEFVKLNGPTALKIAIFDVTRSNGNQVDYDAIEELKGGIFFSGKYESQDIIFNWPHVVIFANFPPDTSKLSNDRWEIKELINKELLVPNKNIEQVDIINNVNIIDTEIEFPTNIAYEM